MAIAFAMYHPFIDRANQPAYPQKVREKTPKTLVNTVPLTHGSLTKLQRNDILIGDKIFLNW